MTVQGPVKEQQPNGMSHRGGGGGAVEPHDDTRRVKGRREVVAGCTTMGDCSANPFRPEDVLNGGVEYPESGLILLCGPEIVPEPNELHDVPLMLVQWCGVCAQPGPWSVHRRGFKPTELAEDRCAARLTGGVNNGCRSGSWRLESGFRSRAGGCKTVGGQWGADGSGWGGTDSHPQRGEDTTLILLRLGIAESVNFPMITFVGVSRFKIPFFNDFECALHRTQLSVLFVLQQRFCSLLYNESMHLFL